MLALVHPRGLSILSLVLLCACAHSPQHSETTKETVTETGDHSFKTNATSQNIDQGMGKNIAELARSQLGSPYKYGGATPSGFDCSGLVHYTHGKLGIHTPRTSLQQYMNSKHVELSKLHAGDLVFFKLNKSRVSHVGIYIGKGRFIHAPKSGKRVSVNFLNDDYWKPRIVRAGRLY